MISRYKVKRMRKIRALTVTVAVVLVGAVVVYFGFNYLQSAKAVSDQTAGTRTAPTSIDAATSLETTPGPYPSPTSPPVADPTPLPPKNPDDLKMSWLTPAVFDGANAFSEQKMTMTGADGTAIDYWIFKGGQAVSEYLSNDPISFGEPDTYTGIEGVLAFRGNNYRNSPSWGSANVSEKKLEIVWTKDIGAVSSTDSYWPGSGWTGQPLLVHWPEATRMAMNISAEMKQKDLVEVIYPVFDGNIYFLDLETGKETREADQRGVHV